MDSQTKPLPNDVPARTVTNFTASRAYRAEVHQRIPGGAHTYSRGDDQFPELGPAAIARGLGGRVWDVDGNEYIDCALALGSVALGHAYEPVLAAVREQLALGAAFQRPAAIELELAREFLAVTPGAERIKFAKNGSTVTTAAVKLARAFTSRPLVAFPKNHPFYSYDDWYIAQTLTTNGIPQEAKRLAVTYDSTKPETLEALFAAHPGEIACVITEPTEYVGQRDEAIREVQRITRRGAALFVLDEMVSGFRAGFPGAYPALGLEPDMVTWGKAAGNGFSFCALTGRADVLDLGGIKQAGAPRVFLISTTHGGEAHALAAARAVLVEYQTKDILGQHRRITAAVAAGMRRAVAAHGIADKLEIHASSWRILVVCRDGEGKVSHGMRTLLMQEMMGRGVLFQGLFLPCYSHTDADVAGIVAAFDASAQVYRHALDRNFDTYLVGDAARPVFRRYNGCKELCPSVPCPNEPRCRNGSQ
ncbi:MAG: aminotransferase class III-fold pyridoxal phosphate-dependent enzyme [Rhodospirillaceae bacterium]|nr:aminotransferase class III-fold pyridoxal phosphate-dependent enzyme [Rhodospirillaceae bacterium]